MSNRPVMIMAGGTGGHIFPALAVAKELSKRNVPVVWLGSEGGMETRIVPDYGIPMETLKIKGVRGKGVATLLLAPFKIAAAVAEAMKVLLKHKPQSVLGMGGFASGPGGLAAAVLRVPVYIHEQNSIPGMTNRWLSKVSKQVMQGFAGALPNGLHTGNPVREEITGMPAPQQRFVDRDGVLRLLVVGGSLGALKFNQEIPKALAMLEANCPEVLHQTGERHLELTRENYATSGVEADVVPFIKDMATAYANADLVIARAGALTVAELQQIGAAAILVPYPYAVDDHQTSNAKALVDAGAAVLLPDAELTAESLKPHLDKLLSDRAQLLHMATKAHNLAKPDAAEIVARVCLGETIELEGAAS